ncbi:unnamed protein product [Nyctereutes procyonoides]|uniref:(raccoon dog) hypothetical protein n=1 Tax=Nyctereutes procyonoides TaxID=34880 RepID=A0A811ZDR5_NYCPR|nr:unnamed protein product [Nyctereutes procyonoides]
MGWEQAGGSSTWRVPPPPSPPPSCQVAGMKGGRRRGRGGRAEEGGAAGAPPPSGPAGGAAAEAAAGARRAAARPAPLRSAPARARPAPFPLGSRSARARTCRVSGIRGRRRHHRKHGDKPPAILFPGMLKIVFLSNLYIQHKARTHNPEIKSCMLYQMNQPGAPHYIHFMIILGICYFILLIILGN